ncbi:MAG: hypothetical protein ACLQGP_21890 [Isosphaeraceae bacterium]
MHRQRITRFRPDIERLEGKQLLSASPLTTHVAHPDAEAKVPALHSDASLKGHRAAVELARKQSTLPIRFLAFRITNTSSPLTVNLKPPFQQVLVQSKQPVPGQVYNILYVAVKNGTAQTFTASNGFTVRLTSQSKAHAYPILTGNEQWKPDQWFVFYVLTKKYYPVSEVAGGFQLNLGGASSTLVPGPSGIFLRVKYDPAKFAGTLNWIVAYGPGAQGGAGPKVGLPDTAINEIVAANTHRIDYAGHF